MDKQAFKHCFPDGQISVQKDPSVPIGQFRSIYTFVDSLYYKVESLSTLYFQLFIYCMVLFLVLFSYQNVCPDYFLINNLYVVLNKKITLW